ncbi:MAG: AbgT family transporter, partial [Thiotrichales bacterium]|nr:AbgT family transporter [Thiotrichales bacterium]
ARLLTPFTILIGILSSVTLDAGYVVLPPIAAAMYLASGRSPVAGIAAAFAGISAGFSANLMITALDPLLAGFTQAGARIIDPDYVVATTANLWFMMVSTLILTLLGWAVTALWVEPALGRTGIQPDSINNISNKLQTVEYKGIKYAFISILCGAVLVYLAISSDAGPLHGSGTRFPRWVEVTVPLLFFFFIVPGIVYGITTGTIKNDRDIARMLGETLGSLGPYIVLAFFAAQFIEAFKYSGLGEMTAISGGQWLAQLGVPHSFLLTAFIGMVVLANLLIGSASAKYAFLAPVFVPMLMQVNISPELTQVAYRIGDSVSNVITPLNPYMIIIVVLVQKYVRGSGLGTVVATMLPYTIVFGIIWTIVLLIWISLGYPLGPGGELYYHTP